MSKIEITCKTGELIEIAKLERFQGELKEITPEAMDKLKASIVKYGFSFPIFVWGSKILDGHQRLGAAKQLINHGYTLKGGKLPVVQIEAKSEQEAAEKLLLINSRYAKMTQAGFDAFVTDFNIDLSDFSGLLEIPEIDFDFDGGGGFDGNTDPDEVPDVQPNIVSKRGDIWILGEHRLMCGDSTLIDDVEALMAGEKADICLTDPPYGIAETGREKGNYDIYEDTQENLIDLASKWLPIAINSSNVVVFSPGIKNIKIYPASDWVLCWFYGSGQSMSRWGFNCWQPFLCYGKDPSLAKGKGSRPDAVDMNIAANAKNIDHPCPKPISLWLWMIERLSFSDGDLFYEPFSGNGTTIIAAQKTNRRCFAMEISERYCDVSIRRWQDFTGQQAALESTGEKFDDIPARQPDNDK